MTNPTTAPLGRTPDPAPLPEVPQPSEPAAEDPARSAAGDDALPPEPPEDVPGSREGARLIRFRVRADHHGLRLRAGESVLCVPYEPAELGMVVLVRCETDGHAPGALLSVRELEYTGEAGRFTGAAAWDEPGTREWPTAERSWRTAWLRRRR